MRAIFIAAVVPAASALWNSALCNGAGGCTAIGGKAAFYDPWRCPDGSGETISLFSGDLRDTSREGATVASPEEFPKTCSDGRYPTASDKLVKIKSSNGQTIYAYLISECKETKPKAPGDCYHYNTNPTTYNFCAMFDPTGGKCEMYRKAGLCERWGYSSVNPQCKFWKQGLPDLPDTERESNGIP